MYLCLPRIDCPSLCANFAAERETTCGSVESTSQSKPGLGACAINETAPPALFNQKPLTPSRREMRLLKWDADSLTSLMNIHREIATALLRSVRKEVMEPPSSTLLTPTSTSCSGRSELCRKAVDSLTISLSATGIARSQSFFVESAESVRAAREETRIANDFRSQSSAAVDPNLISHNDESEEFLWVTTPLVHSSNRWRLPHRSADSLAGENEEASNTSSKMGCEVGVRCTEDEKRVGLWHITTGSASGAIASFERIAELYAMRCTANEGLGLLQAAFNDVRNALTLKPRTPKLLAKAASIALRVESPKQISGVQDWAGAQRETVQVRRPRRRLGFATWVCYKY